MYLSSFISVLLITLTISKFIEIRINRSVKNFCIPRKLHMRNATIDSIGKFDRIQIDNTIFDEIQLHIQTCNSIPFFNNKQILMKIIIEHE